MMCSKSLPRRPTPKSNAIPGIVLTKRAAGEDAGLAVGLGRVRVDIVLGVGRGNRLERDGGEDVETNERRKGERNGDSDQVDIDGQPTGCVRFGRGVVILRDCHDVVSCTWFGKKKNPRIAIYADTWVPEVSKLKSLLFA